MEVLDIFGDNRFDSYSKVREACRGIVLSDNNILLTYEVNTNQWFIPGGGLERQETFEECCIRELAEETGYLVEPKTKYLTIREYYEEWLYISHYYVCDILDKTERSLTTRERDVGLEPRWIPLREAVDIFSKHDDYRDSDEMKRGAYLREYQAFSAFLKLDKKLGQC